MLVNAKAWFIKTVIVSECSHLDFGMFPSLNDILLIFLIKEEIITISEFQADD